MSLGTAIKTIATSVLHSFGTSAVYTTKSITVVPTTGHASGNATTTFNVKVSPPKPMSTYDKGQTIQTTTFKCYMEMDPGDVQINPVQTAAFSVYLQVGSILYTVTKTSVLTAMGTNVVYELELKR